MLPPKTARKFKGVATDNVDAWLISYADLITLLFMLFVIIVSVSVTRQGLSSAPDSTAMEISPPPAHTGTMTLGTPYDDAYHNLVGVVAATQSDQHIAVEKSAQGVWVDISAAPFFEEGSATIQKAQLPLLASIAHVLKNAATDTMMIEVEGHTDDAPPVGGLYDNNLDLASARASHVVSALIEAGVNPARLRATGLGSVNPVVPNLDTLGNPIAHNRSRNQRMVIRLQQEKLPG